MAVIKSYTDLQQSKKLAEILPFESADMYWFRDNIETPEIYPKNMMKDSVSVTLPCWSLASLLDVIPKHFKYYNVLRIDIKEDYTSIWYKEVAYNVNNDLPDITKDNPIDACVAMIEKLNELNLL